VTHLGGILRATTVLLLLACPFLGACASPGESAPAQTEIGFVDSRVFDDQLKASLGADPAEVQVFFRGTDATVNHIPDRVNVWLQTIAKREGGKVEVLPDPNQPQARAVEGIALSLMIGAYNLLHDAAYYWPAREYDAAVYYLDGPGTLTRIVFKRVAEGN
jgi:hypothetical protein